MNEDTMAYLSEQLAMFEGGYPTVTATFRLHIVGTERDAVVNLSVFETGTGEPIAIQAPVIRCTLGDADELASQLAVAIRQVYGLVSPF